MQKLTFLFIMAFSYGQSAISQTTLNAGSHAAQLNQQMYEYAIGEMTLVSTIQSPKVILTQGFLQPQLIVTNQSVSNDNPKSELINNMKVYPNPTENRLFVEFVTDESTTVTYQLFDASSKMIINKNEQYEKGIHKYTLDLSLFASGTYFLMIKNESADKVPANYTYKIQKVQ